MNQIVYFDHPKEFLRRDNSEIGEFEGSISGDIIPPFWSLFEYTVGLIVLAYPAKGHVNGQGKRLSAPLFCDLHLIIRDFDNDFGKLI